jgi:hypothetical protein
MLEHENYLKKKFKTDTDFCNKNPKIISWVDHKEQVGKRIMNNLYSTNLKDKIRLVYKIARNSSSYKNEIIHVNFSREAFEPESFYFDIRKDKRVLQGTIIKIDDEYFIFP